MSKVFYILKLQYSFTETMRHYLSIEHVIDRYYSVLWTDKFVENGECELQLPLDIMSYNDIRELSINNSIIYNPDEWVYMKHMIIDSTEINVDENGNRVLKITGKSLESTLNNRVLLQKTLIRNGVQDAIRQLIKSNFASDLPTYTYKDRYNKVKDSETWYDITMPISYRDYSSYAGSSRVTGMFFKYNDIFNNINVDDVVFNYGERILDVIHTILSMVAVEEEQYSIHFVIDPYSSKYDGLTDLSGEFDLSLFSNVFLIYLVKGADKRNKVILSYNLDEVVSYSETDNNNAYDYIAIFNKIYDRNDSRNHPDIKYYEKYFSTSGDQLFLKEYAITSANIDETTTNALGQTTTLTQSEYDTVIENEVEKVYNENVKNEHVASLKTIENEYSYKYGTDYSMGDIITIQDEFGNDHSAQVVEYITSYDQNGINRYPTFKILD